MIKKSTIFVIVILVIVVVAIFLLESRKAKRPGSSAGPDSEIGVEISGGEAISVEEREKRIEEKSSKYEKAKEISSPDGFINTDGISIADLVGKKVILVDFWTYSCINCQRTLPYLNSWHDEYSDKGLVILGIHTPEFEFEKDYDNVKRAVEKYGVEYPVILDNDYSTWTAYRNRYWPRKYLIDIDGFIVYDHIGEGGYDETEEKIVELLNERSETLGDEAVAMIDMPVSADSVDFSKVRTPETYLGYERGAGLPPDQCLDEVCEFVKPESLSLNAYAISGKWLIEKEKVSLAEGEGDIVIKFSANKVNLVAGGEVVKAEILLDGKKISPDLSGKDVSDGTVTFEGYDLYNLVDLKGNYGEHELTIRFLEPGVSAFAFTFG